MRAHLIHYEQELVHMRWPFYGWHAMYRMQREHQMALLRANSRGV